MKKGMTKETETIETTLRANCFYIQGFSWLQHDPNNLATARLEIVYGLAEEGPDGTIYPSAAPGHQAIRLVVYDAGDNRRLTTWMEQSGDPDDLFDWNYRDIERLVEADIAKRFGYTV